jgi:hypothetical protein
MLISLKAGALGLNLTVSISLFRLMPWVTLLQVANNVYLMDPCVLI